MPLEHVDPAPPDASDAERKDKYIEEPTPVGFDDVCDFVVDYIDSNNVVSERLGISKEQLR